MQTRRTEKPFELRDSRALCECWDLPALLFTCQHTLFPWQRDCTQLLRQHVPAYVHHIRLYVSAILRSRRSLTGIEKSWVRVLAQTGCVWDLAYFAILPSRTDEPGRGVSSLGIRSSGMQWRVIRHIADVSEGHNRLHHSG
jgi:hypothetical protein